LQVYDGLSYSTETSQNLLEVNAHIKVLFWRCYLKFDANCTDTPQDMKG
jgi:hypothetical protein